MFLGDLLGGVGRTPWLDYSCPRQTASQNRRNRSCDNWLLDFSHNTQWTSCAHRIWWVHHWKTINPLQNVSNGNWIHRREWIHRLDQIEQKLNSLNRWWQGDNDIDSLQRQKRRLFDFIGKISHFLFGTATAKEVNDVKDTLRELGTNQGRIRHDMVRFASVVNNTFDEMNKTRQMLKDVNDFANKGLT